MALYEPTSKAANDALARSLSKSGLKATVRLPDPTQTSTLRYGRLPYSTLLVSLRNGKTPNRAEVVQAVEAALADLRTRFGRAALDLNGTLFGELPDSH